MRYSVSSEWAPMAVFGGTAPLIATWLISKTGSLTAPAWYVAMIAVLNAGATLTLKSR